MTDDSINAKAVALVNEVQDEDGTKKFSHHYYFDALCRAIEQREATKQEFSDFRQKVSDAVEDALPWCEPQKCISRAQRVRLSKFTIPKPKLDPLAEAMLAIGVIPDANSLRAALEARGFEIREKGQ